MGRPFAGEADYGGERRFGQPRGRTVATRRHTLYRSGVSLPEIKEQLAQLRPAEQRELIGFLLAQGQTEREEWEFRNQLTQTRDDRVSKDWLTREEARKALGS